jgi:hypothetical protein
MKRSKETNAFMLQYKKLRLTSVIKKLTNLMKTANPPARECLTYTRKYNLSSSWKISHSLSNEG